MNRTTSRIEMGGSLPGGGRSVPLLWRISVSAPEGLRVPGVGASLSWPEQGPALVRGIVEPSCAPDAIAGLDLWIGEVRDARELSQLATTAAREDVGVVAFLDPSIPAFAADVASAICPTLGLVHRTARARDDAERAAQVVAEVVRRRAIRHLLAGWLGEARAFEAAIAAMDPMWRPSGAGPTPGYAPLAVIEHAHVASIAGLWLARPTKLAAAWEVSFDTARTLLARCHTHWKAWHAAATEVVPVRVLVVESSSAIASRVASRLERRNGPRAVGFAVSVVASAREAFAWVDREGMPDLVWFDAALSTAHDGVELCAWLRARGACPPAIVRVRGSDRMRARWASLDIVTAPDGDAGPADDAIEAALDRVRGRAIGLAALRRLSRLITHAERELAPMPALVGSPRPSLADIRRAAAKEALGLANNAREAAAHLLGITPKSLRSLLAEPNADVRADPVAAPIV